MVAQHADQVVGKLMRTSMGVGVNQHCFGFLDNFDPRPAWAFACI
jgi:hypothetical protein